MVELATHTATTEFTPVRDFEFTVVNAGTNVESAKHFHYIVEQANASQGPGVYNYLAQNSKKAGTEREVISASSPEAAAEFSNVLEQMAAIQQQFDRSRSTTQITR
jgi:hypothetical protein